MYLNEYRLFYCLFDWSEKLTGGIHKMWDWEIQKFRIIFLRRVCGVVKQIFDVNTEI